VKSFYFWVGLAGDDGGTTAGRHLRRRKFERRQRETRERGVREEGKKL
jgi:hypothetical protein